MQKYIYYQNICKGYTVKNFKAVWTQLLSS